MSVIDRLKPAEKRLIAALVEHKTIKGAAKALGVAESSLHVRLSLNPHLRVAWNEACTEAVQDACAILAGFSAEAATMLVEAVRGEAPINSVTLRALESVLDRALDYFRQKKLEDEIAALKRSLEDRGILPDGENAHQSGT